MDEIPEIIKILAQKASKHKLVPFIGAGLSVPHLHFDWDKARDEMAKILEINIEDHLEIADKFIAKFGREHFCKYIESRILIQDFKDDMGEAYLSLLGLNIGVIYSTNQDNVFEKCIEKYGREVIKIVTLEDIADSLPGDFFFYKYHGDIHAPETIVFGKKDYEERMLDNHHFLNIRLRSDLIAKSFLFVGYSFRDINIKEIFRELNKVFGSKLPESFLLAFDYSEDLEFLNSTYGVKVIDPQKVYPGLAPVVAFNHFLAQLNNETIMLKNRENIADLFSSKKPNSVRVVMKNEMNALSHSIKDKNCEESCELFRAIFDLTHIPIDYEKDTFNIFFEIAKKARKHEDSDNVMGILFNLRIKDIDLKINLGAIALALSSIRRPVRGIGDLYILSPGFLPEEVGYFVACVAVDYVVELKLEFNDSFGRVLTRYLEKAPLISSLPEKDQSSIKTQCDKAWNRVTTFEHPIQRNIIMSKHKGLTSKGYSEILNDITSTFPKTFIKPHEE